MCRTFLHLPRVQLDGRSIIDSALHNLGPTEEEAMCVEQLASSIMDYDSVTSVLERFTRQVVGNAYSDILSSLIRFRCMDYVQDTIPFCYVCYYYDRTVRRRVNRATAIANNSGLNCFLFHDYDRDIRHTLERANSDVMWTHPILIETDVCLAYREDVEKCFCNICRELGQSETEPTLFGHKLIRVSRMLQNLNLSSISNSVFPPFRTGALCMDDEGLAHTHVIPTDGNVPGVHEIDTNESSNDVFLVPGQDSEETTIEVGTDEPT